MTDEINEKMDQGFAIDNDPQSCRHLHLAKLAPNSPANGLHQGPEQAYHCHECGATFFVLLEPAKIRVITGAERRAQQAKGDGK